MVSRIASETLARRLGQIRRERYGEDGADALARALGIPTDSWLNYERGIEVPGRILLDLIALTDVDPAWLATGRGPRFRGRVTA